VEADELQAGFQAMLKARDERNEAVHGLATRPAHVQKQLISMASEAFKKQQWDAANNREAVYEDVIHELNRQDTEELSDVEARAKLLCDYYVKLVKMGELSFRTEHGRRQGRRGSVLG
jgi:hypothetical protein